jgi:carboxylesterase
MLIPGAEPFFFRGNAMGALLIHGFTGTPREMRPVGEMLAAEGLTVLGIRLPQHATQPDDMAHSHRRDWFAAALDGYLMLKDQCQQVLVMGLSTGGTLALWLAATQPVQGVVALSAPGRPMYQRLQKFLPIAALYELIRPSVGKRKRTASVEADHISYPAYPTRAVPQFVRLLREVDDVLPQVTCPALLIHSRQDETVAPENMPHIFARLNSLNKEMAWLERSSHVITKDCEKDLVLGRVKAFVKSNW